jgi:RND family efflux transporter MFP subunit
MHHTAFPMDLSTSKPGPRTHQRRAAFLAVLLSLAGCERKPTVSLPPREPVAVVTERVETRPMDRTIPSLGTLQAIDRATVSIKTTGRLRTLNVDVGSKVSAGETLAQIEPRDYELRLRQSAALLSQARAQLGLPIDGEDDSVAIEKVNVVRESKALLDEAIKNLGRTQKLVTEKIASDTEFERASTDHQVLLNRYHDSIQVARERQALLAQRRAEYDIAKQQLTDTALRAPFDGVVQERLTNVGEFLTSGSPVLSIVRANPLRLRLDVPERLASPIKPGLRVQVSLEGDTNIYTGTLLRVAPALDPRARMLITEAELQNPGNLRPGTFARAHILVEEAVPTLAAPADAVISFAGIERIYLAITNRAVERLVTTGRRDGNWVEILKGISPGDRVIRRPGGLQNGDPIREGSPEAPKKPTKLS